MARRYKKITMSTLRPYVKQYMAAVRSFKKRR